jgi:hypothetical protein
MSTPFLLKDVCLDAHLVKAPASRAAIDPPSNLAKSTVHIFTGGSDSVVSPETVEKGRNVYAALAELSSQDGSAAAIDVNPYGCWNWWGYAKDP